MEIIVFERWNFSWYGNDIDHCIHEYICDNDSQAGPFVIMIICYSSLILLKEKCIQHWTYIEQVSSNRSSSSHNALRRNHIWRDEMMIGVLESRRYFLSSKQMLSVYWLSRQKNALKTISQKCLFFICEHIIFQHQ